MKKQININPATLQKHSMSLGIGILRLFLFVTLAFIVIYPVLTQISATFMSVSDVYNSSVQYIPKNFSFSNYTTLWQKLELGDSMLLTLQYTILNAIIQTASATLVGYGLARFKFKGNGILFVMALISLAIPPTLRLIPLYKTFATFDIFGLIRLISGKSLNLLNTQWGMILLSITATGYRCGLYIILMRQYFRGVPKELEEAAYIDGAGTVKTFVSIMLPSAKTMMITVGLFAFVWIWLDSDFAPTLMSDMPLLDNQFAKIASTWRTVANSGIVTSLYYNTAVIYLILPLIILYLFTQKYFVESIERSGLVG